MVSENKLVNSKGDNNGMLYKLTAKEGDSPVHLKHLADRVR